MVSKSAVKGLSFNAKALREERRRNRLSDPKPRAVRARGPNTVLKHHVLLGTALEWAWKQRWIGENVARRATHPTRVPYDGAIFDTEQLRLFLGAARRELPLRMYALFLTAATTGLRQSELLAAQWEGLGPDGTLMIRKALVRVPGQPWALKVPKSRAGNRPVVLDNRVLEVLRELRAEQQRERELLGDRYHDHGFIFATRDGRPLRGHDVVSRFYKPLLERAGLPPVPMKNLRHSHLSHMQRVGAPVSVAQQRAGHSNARITLDVYTKAQADEQRDPARRIADDLLGASGSRAASSPLGQERTRTGHTRDTADGDRGGDPTQERHGSGIDGILGGHPIGGAEGNR